MDEEDYQESVENDLSSEQEVQNEENYGLEEESDEDEERDGGDDDDDDDESEDHKQYILSPQQQHRQHAQPKEVLTNNLLDKDILNFLLEHRNEFTLNVLQKVNKILNTIKAEDPNYEIDQYIEKLRLDKSTLFKEIKDLQESKKSLDFKLQLLKKRYEDELNSNNEIKIDNIFQNSGAKDYIEKMKSRDKVTSDMVLNLKQQLEATMTELDVVRTRCSKAEEQCEYYKQQWRDAQAKKWNSEAERTAIQSRERQILEQSMNRSYASSYIETNQPPPVTIPTIEEILKSDDDGLTTSFDYSSSGIVMGASSTSNQLQQSSSLFYSDNNVRLTDRRLNNARI